MILDDFLQRFGSTLATEPVLALLIALVGGVVACSVCPCTVPMGLGMAGVVGVYEGNETRRGLLIASAFFAGIVVNLALLGALAGQLGSVLTDSFGRYWTLAMAIASLAAAIVAFRGPRVPVAKLAQLRKPGLAGAFGYGFFFSLGTSAAPLLLLLTISAAQATPAYGLLLATAFGIGRGLPFLVVGLFAGAIVRFTAIGHWRRTIQLVSGSALLAVSAYYVRAFAALTL